jgi:hypothetical protein
MIKIFSESECRDIINSGVDWKYYNFDFEYHQIFLKEKWIYDRLVDVIGKEKDIKIERIPMIRLIRLSVGQKLALHTYNYSNTNSVLKNTIFTSVAFLNKEFEGGKIYINNKRIRHNIGEGFLHDRDSTEHITEIKKGTFYLILAHIDKIATDKLF